MKILKLSPYYYPEQVSSSHLSDDLEEALVRAGIEIEIYAPTPTRGISDETRKKYKKIKFEEFQQGHIKLHRFSMFPEKRNPIVRGIRYILVNMIQYFKTSSSKNIDVIYAASTPPTQGVLCGLVKKKLSKKYGYKVPFIYNLQDVFPDSLVHAGMTKRGSFVWKIGREIEKYTYNSADLIIVISEDIKNNIIKKGVPKEKIRVIRNWIDSNQVRHVRKEDNKLRQELKIDSDKFKIVYAGNLGKMQGMNVIVDVAEKLKNDKTIEFIIFGDGQEKNNIKDRINKLKLENIRIFPLQPTDRISEVYSLGDASIVSCKKGLGTGAFPSKTVSIMATETPVIALFDQGSELCNIIEKYNVGVCVEPESGEDLIKKIKLLQSDKENLKTKGINGRKLVEKEFSKKQCIEAYINAFKECC